MGVFLGSIQYLVVVSTFRLQSLQRWAESVLVYKKKVLNGGTLCEKAVSGLSPTLYGLVSTLSEVAHVFIATNNT